MNLICKNIPFKKIDLINKIYKNIFLDKKRLDKNPRYISIKKFQKAKIKEIDNFNFLNDVIAQVIK